MRLIYCKIDPFAYDQKVCIADDYTQAELGKCLLEDLPVFITNKCNEYGIDEVALTGFSQYTNNVAKEIAEYSKTKYNKNINVTVRK